MRRPSYLRGRPVRDLPMDIEPWPDPPEPPDQWWGGALEIEYTWPDEEPVEAD